MAVEWVPRSPRRENGWLAPVGTAEVAAPTAGELPVAEGAERIAVVREVTRGVRVPVVVRPMGLPVLRGWMVLILVMNVGNLMRGARSAWSVLSTSGLLMLALALALLTLLYRSLRLRPLTGRDQPDLVLTADGIHSGGLVVPWTSVEEVVRFTFGGGPGRGGPGPRSYLAVRVRDFVGVRGLSPARAGLANLTRRRLVVLCETREVHDPVALGDALELLVADPAARELLSGHEGVRLVSVGPPGGGRAAA